MSQTQTQTKTKTKTAVAVALVTLAAGGAMAGMLMVRKAMPAPTPVPINAPSNLTCTDSDSGFKNYYYIKGTAKSVTSRGKMETTQTDGCFEGVTLMEASCNKDGTIAVTNFNCPNGCKDGACVEKCAKEGQPVLTPGYPNNSNIPTVCCGDLVPTQSKSSMTCQMPPYIKLISPNGGENWEAGKTYQVKWKSAGVKIWNYVVTINLVGSENTPNVIQDKTVSGNLSNTQLTLKKDIKPGSGYKIQVEFCKKNKDGSMICGDGAINGIGSDESDSAFSIIEKTSPLTCTDSDSGFKNYYYIKGTAKSVASGSRMETTQSDGCFEGVTLMEASCNKDGTIAVTNFNCPNGCKDGACVEKVACTDSDKSPDFIKNEVVYPITFNKYPSFFVKSVGKGEYDGSVTPYIWGQEPDPTSPKPTTNSYTTYYDHCAGADQLNEAFCRSDGKLSAYGVTCSKGCKDGACIK